MSATVRAVLTMAASQIGISEIPRGSNRVPYSGWYGIIGPWCDMFVSWVADQTGSTDIIGKFAYTPSHVNWFKKNGRWHTGTPSPGDLAFYDFGLGRVSHVGFVEKVFSDGTMQTIEGNTDEAGGRTGGKVMRKTRSQHQYVVGYGRPAYKAEVRPSRSDTRSWVKLFQRTYLEFSAANSDGQWGPATDKRANYMRVTARNGNDPGSGTGRATTILIQKIIDTTADGDWGIKSTAAMKRWVMDFQKFLGFTGTSVDGDWGAKTEAAYQAKRKLYYGK